jgi:hippurate hydrolase
MHIDEILKEAELIIDDIFNELVSFRHTLHEVPEIGLKEYKTSSLIREALSKYDIPFLPPYIETDVVGLINPDKENVNVTLRADIDAIGQYELNNFPYKSKTEGLMHACGHDGHASILLGTAVVLNKLKQHIPGSVRFIFQPGEEGLNGAEHLVEKGLFQSNKPSAVLGLHNFPTLNEGVFYGKPGVFTSSVTPFKINIIGKSIHSSTPEKGIDPILIATEIVSEFNRIINDTENILFGTNLKVCKFHSGTAGNVIPPNALLEGTARCYEEYQEEQTPMIINSVVEEVCEKYGANFEVKVNSPMRLINNDSKLLKKAKQAVKELFGSDSWYDVNAPFRFSEDFSVYHKDFPGLYLCIGAGKDKAALHTQTYDFNDNIIKKAILFWIKMTLDILYK